VLDSNFIGLVLGTLLHHVLLLLTLAPHTTCNLHGHRKKQNYSLSCCFNHNVFSNPGLYD
jgi:hypothetical protein